MGAIYPPQYAEEEDDEEAECEFMNNKLSAISSSLVECLYGTIHRMIPKYSNDVALKWIRVVSQDVLC